MRRWLIVLLIGGFGSSCVGAAEWEPAKSHVVICGLLQWEDQFLPPFPLKNRKDQELHDVLVLRGVPAKNIALLLDDQATLKNIRAALTAALQRCRADETLIFYYCGHGLRGREVVYLANYDFDRQKHQQTGLTTKELAQTLTTGGKPGQVWLMADCCHSGALKDVAAALTAVKIPNVCLTSAPTDSVSTGNWTFTQTVLDCLRGEPLADANGDQALVLGEVAEEVRKAMLYREEQMAECAVSASLREVRLAQVVRPAPANGAGAYRLGDYVLAPDKRGWRAARLVGRDESAYVAQFYDYSTHRMVSVPASALKPFQWERHPVGSEVAVLWRGVPFRAKITAMRDDFHRISYAGYGSEWDEWVLSSRIQPLKMGMKLGPLPNQEKATIEVEWQSRWYPATVLKREGEKLFIHYVGFGAEWDEWVTKDRVRVLAQRP